jgi:aspartate aminotransferase-like enzyme
VAEAAEAEEAEEAGGDKIKEKLWRIGAGTVTLFIWKRVTSSARRALRRLAARSAKGRFNNNENCFF